MITVASDEKPQENLNVFELMKEVLFTDFKYQVKCILSHIFHS
jgi:hypothetical protein